MVHHTEEPRSPADLLGEVRAAVDTLSSAEKALTEAVGLARQAGHTWQQIGETLGITRQAAFKRFGHVMDPATGDTVTLATTAPVATLTEQVVTWLASGKLNDLHRAMTWTCRRQLPQRELASTWAEVLAAVGAVEHVDSHQVRDAHGHVLVEDAEVGETYPVPGIGRVIVHHEAGESVCHVAFSRDGKVSGVLLAMVEDEDSLPF